MTDCRHCCNITACPCCRSFTLGEEVAILTDAESRTLHARAVVESRAVSAELWQALHEPLYRRLRAKFPVLEEAEIRDAVLDVILGYAELPAAYNPDKLTLDRYLFMAARGDLLNLLKKQQRALKVMSIEDVAEGALAGNSEYEGEGEVMESEARIELLRQVREVIPEPAYREVLELMADGERDSRRFAVPLGCDELGIAEQRKRVKQAKDVIRLRLKRNGIRFDG